MIIKTHRGFKRRLGDVRYAPKFERNLILAGRLESKGWTFKASGETLKVKSESLGPMKGKRSERNLNELQVGSGCLGHKSDNNVVCESTKNLRMV